MINALKLCTSFPHYHSCYRAEDSLHQIEAGLIHMLFLFFGSRY